ncbi:hypothetical protein A2962_00260 [Candidatus Woesebacteria bacterium RIFCSPLOWO2_01_FULL_39_61]|uniref:Membrane protein containing DUF457, transmembrane n=1 Tax=Candidatus Woesebacteria bacterium RIFCSPHIGHO2_02_FULL_39_13 TaxID=1802505 RepID=A0A1F7Z2S6_9BACT|nr:MAG: hypothetical protein A2692_05800 [Candidatus Woesebacteria bacterium RIFCSPHIGHO2_01_FULL_39_95]OGM33774.1 MAG: hypothetical protein A3D01_02275 [Candidatus Woesebacteria bacterium RIFCSPHIGHO2_02_FULL_39_13]OGM37589.1 MAG: hypothetical protein A3E13_01410 [Candidatus Woesebacteria bacterium RIFCSPHIGHO2_12_FULL_40_20]OGM65512.1 MAG: hypothetical protein A2962_00260 [Candidatus Woesebacteria bacterium RIFCSPLOWO2_01_FULL_39_61]OGM72517.1 MAG: hypothetical protein A3H19_01065 [Candidatus
MTARTHDAFAFASLVTAVAYYPPTTLNLYTLFAALIGNIIGALIPDMDSAGNRLWDLLPGGDGLGKFARRVFYKHRTITHSLVGLYLTYRLLDWGLPKIFNSNFIDPKLLMISIMIGYISHLFADSLTEEGVPLFFPINFNFGIPPIKKVRIKTGGWFENLVILPGVGIYLVWFITTHREVLIRIFALIRG